MVRKIYHYLFIGAKFMYVQLNEVERILKRQKGFYLKESCSLALAYIHDPVIYLLHPHLFHYPRLIKEHCRYWYRHWW